MITAPPGVRVLVWSAPVDFRRGMDSLAALVQVTLRLDPIRRRCLRVPLAPLGPGEAARLRRDRSGSGDEAVGSWSFQVAAGDRWCGPAVGAAAVRPALRPTLGASAGSAGAAPDGRLLRGMMWI